MTGHGIKSNSPSPGLLSSSLADPRAGSGLLQEQGCLPSPTLHPGCDQRVFMKPGLGALDLIHSPTAGIECKRERIKRGQHVFSSVMQGSTVEEAVQM